MSNTNQNNKNDEDVYNSFMNKYIQQKKEYSDKKNTINELKKHLRTNYNIFDPTVLLEKIENSEITTIEDLDFEVKKYEEQRKRKSKLEAEQYDDVRNKIAQQKLEDRKHIKENQQRRKEAIKSFEKEKAKREELKLKQRKKEKNYTKFTTNDSSSKIQLPKSGEVEIEIIKNVKSNTALASAALFLTTGIFLAGAKEENKWVKTTLKFDTEKIEIKNPHFKIKYKDMKKIQIRQDNDWNLFHVAFDNNKEIYFKTKYEYLYEILNENLNHF